MLSHASLSRLQDYNLNLEIQNYVLIHILPKLYSLKLYFKTPPKKCQMNVTPTTGSELNTKFMVIITNCQTQSSYLVHKIYLYRSQEELDYDIKNNSLSNGFQLTQSHNVSSTQTLFMVNVKPA